MPRPHNAVAIDATTFYRLRKYAIAETPNSYRINISGIPALYVHDRGTYYACILWPERAVP